MVRGWINRTMIYVLWSAKGLQLSSKDSPWDQCDMIKICETPGQLHCTVIQNPEPRNFSKKNSKITPQAPSPNSKKTRKNTWAAANGGVTNGGLRGVWPPFLEISRNRPFSPFFCLFCPFPEGEKSTWGNPENRGKGPFSSDILRFA